MADPKASIWRLKLIVFLVVFFSAIGCALFTNHVWEDYYITFRSSKNLATGHGLVFNVGDRLHTFTSPLGVLLPTMASLVTGNSSDVAAIWVFRLVSAAAFAGALTLLIGVASRFNYGLFATLSLVILVGWDAKSLDFTTNGMETGFLLLFLAYAIWALFSQPRPRYLHLGLAWGGLMWTRPDSFIYIGLLTTGAFFFNDFARTGLKRRELLGLFFKAGLVCAVVYLPWFVWSWSYYGSPVPHTILAKGNVSPGDRTALGALKVFLNFPWSVWQGGTSLESTFLASYFQAGGWPVSIVKAARGLGLILAFQWILPWWRMEIRVASFVFAGMHVYLSYFPYFPFPWYLPGTTLFAGLIISGMAAQLLTSTENERSGVGVKKLVRFSSFIFQFVVLSALCGQIWLTWQMMKQMKVEQSLDANVVRKQTGLWLKDHGKPGDTVFMEPLGHIGYFSGLKTYDWPGLSSREMVDAIRALGVDWARIIEYLSPDWIVLRPHEVSNVRNSIGRVLGETYQFVTEFNNLAAIKQSPIYGREYLEIDARLQVYHRERPKRFRVDVNDPATVANFPLPQEAFEEAGTTMYKLHAAGLMNLKVPADARRIQLKFGLPRMTYQSSPVTDGARFVVLFFDGKKSTTLFSRYLNPAADPADRGVQSLSLDLPPSFRNGERGITLVSEPGATDAMDWCCWSLPSFTN